MRTTETRDLFERKSDKFRHVNRLTTVVLGQWWATHMWFGEYQCDKLRLRLLRALQTSVAYEPEMLLHTQINKNFLTIGDEIFQGRGVVWCCRSIPMFRKEYAPLKRRITYMKIHVSVSQRLSSEH
jgi:hypothetical protein